MSVDEREKTFPGGPDESPSRSEPVAKRMCTESNSIEVLEEESSSSNELTILDILNEDCWKMVFNYVGLRRLIQSEATSKRWRSIVQRYYQGIRICLRHDEYINWWYEPPTKARVLYMPFYMVEALVEKFGSKVEAAFCSDPTDLSAIVEHCPNLEDLKVIRPDSDMLLSDDDRQAPKLKKLKRVALEVAPYFDDYDISTFIQSTALEDLVVNDNIRITGRFLKKLQSNLNSVRIDHCRKFNVGNLASCAKKRLTELKKLSLVKNSTATLRNAYKVIERTPKLECLSLERYEYPTEVGGLVNAICRLSQLTHLSFEENINACDQWLEHFGLCCKRLRFVSVANCKNVTGAGVSSLCRGAGGSLVRLDVSSNAYITDDHVACCIRACPKLERLDVACCRQLTAGLPAAADAAFAASAPRPRLRLRLSFSGRYSAEPWRKKTENVYLDWGGRSSPTPWDDHYSEMYGRASKRVPRTIC